MGDKKKNHQTATQICVQTLYKLSVYTSIVANGVCVCVFFVCACGQTDSLQQQEMRRGVGGKHLPKKKTQLTKTHFLISSLLIFQTLQEENKTD
jgi:hypothetical protein